MGGEKPPSIVNCRFGHDSGGERKHGLTIDMLGAARAELEKNSKGLSSYGHGMGQSVWVWTENVNVPTKM